MSFSIRKVSSLSEKVEKEKKIPHREPHISGDKETMDNKDIQTGTFDDELNARNLELEKQRKERQNRSDEMTLNAIFERVQSRQADIQVFISNMKRPEKALRGLLWNEIKYAADGNLLCTVYCERRKSEQRVIAYTGCCWEMIDQQM